MWKKQILMGFRLAIAATVILFGFSCATQKEMGGNGYEVRVSLFDAKPHCGGAPPERDVVYPIQEPLLEFGMLLFAENSDGTRGKELKKVKTDETGQFKVSLPSGKYQLWLPSKTLSFKDFVAQEKSIKDKFYTYKEEDCFLAWKESADFRFEVKSDSSFAFSFANKCYTGRNPCLVYNGPFAP